MKMKFLNWRYLIMRCIFATAQLCVQLLVLLWDSISIRSINIVWKFNKKKNDFLKTKQSIDMTIVLRNAAVLSGPLCVNFRFVINLIAAVRIVLLVRKQRLSLKELIWSTLVAAAVAPHPGNDNTCCLCESPICECTFYLEFYCFSVYQKEKKRINSRTCKFYICHYHALLQCQADAFHI